MLEEGYIKTFRQLKQWQHYQEPTVVLVWIDILLSVNTKDAWWHGRKIRRGELFTSIETIHQSTGLDPKTIRKALETLEESGEIKREATNAGTKIVVNHFNKFQGWGITPQPTPQPTPHKQEYKKEEKEKNLRKKEELISPPLPPEGETAKKKEKKPKEKPRAVTKYDKAFEEAYLKHKGMPFAWSKRENIACNAIVGKIAAIMAAQGQVPTDDSKLEAFKWLVDKVATNGDDWMRANLTPHVIDYKFNEYYQRIKSQENGTSRNNKQNPYGVSDEYLARIARELGGVL